MGHEEQDPLGCLITSLLHSEFKSGVDNISSQSLR